MAIPELIARIAGTPDCRVLPPTALPTIAPHHSIPSDVLEFYSLCGGAFLFESSAYGFHILPPESFAWIDAVFYKGIEDQIFRCDKNGTPLYFAGDDEWIPDITASWYAMADAENGNFISLDCSMERNGWCYPSFVDTHRVAGSCPVISRSFAGFLEATLREQGEYYYWLEPDFKQLGDAYD